MGAGVSNHRYQESTTILGSRTTMEACHTGHEVDAEQRAMKNYGHIHPSTPAGIRLRRKLMHYGEKILTQHEDATPRIMFTVVIAMLDHHNQPRRLLQVFADMEEFEIKPDAPTVERVVKTYRGLGLLKRADAIGPCTHPLNGVTGIVRGERNTG